MRKMNFTAAGRFHREPDMQRSPQSRNEPSANITWVCLAANEIERYMYQIDLVERTLFLGPWALAIFLSISKIVASG
ncbi:hypothetical protein EN866_28465 [Mesorhizobium sp. M2D.F.Ca.ET.223.01.1.1]|uniref:hypothetical protein n=1 Tax=unclassified Mesorhizobium TaxID=325217 RepID=UPI000FCB5D4E|nr:MULTISPECIES: hypothetical protein [unclassified Mesorhizobium]TGP31355.1 hypothetical protein EN875_022825 [Mesorhizobium sp. M2D.F.Ca.ET.232.01.1.1]TGP54329.1 hypothetical protein EN869_028500 [Mesorhizobium sp. M2D.F.Ca.ET.226.01.1.1]TGP74795.1 hypothetical protein EN870_26370 [bacterium M00.F.Ca.ET.227.01.1.1]TGP84690.1 hypothetical protein EN864_29175 [bacterium M00.F.Ca.ET.221.01.1.1]TGR88125.1 hypothetical protein EN852_040500 [Mesorhizobium sp. M2E.F.Ca.ET.209.01.1.1]TGT97159.1 hyp